jgi:FixJ family two-component response regulator
MAPDHIVYIVDDDPRIRESIIELLESFGMNVLASGSVAEFMTHPRLELPACLILDVELPDMNGLDFQGRIAQGADVPQNMPHIVFITGHGDVPSSVRAIKAGAVDFLVKPFKHEDLMRAIESALMQNRKTRAQRAELVEFRERLATLTRRELEVLPLVVSGLLNKQSAAELGISENTLQIHRGSVMKKMRAGSLADLVRMADVLEITATRSRRPSS